MKEFLRDCRITIKNWVDYLVYGHKIRYINWWTILIDLLILIYALSDFQTLKNENIFVLIIIVFTILWQGISFLNDYRHYVKRTSFYRLHPIINDIRSNESTKSIISDEIKKIYETELHFANTTLICSKKINELLQKQIPIRVLLSTQKEKKVIRYIRTYKDILLPFLNDKWHEMRQRHGSFYNEKKLCMASEFIECEGGFNVLVCLGNYYNSYLTNFIYSKKLSHQSGWGMLPPANISNYPICKFEESIMSDHIGISTLAITADGYVIILCHNNKTLSGVDQLTPSGSGSVDFNDLHENADLRTTLLAAAERELCEETNILAQRICKSEITGFYRDLERGGKPEFCCVTYLNVTYFELSELEPNREEQQDEHKKFKILSNDKQWLKGDDVQIFEKMVLHNNSSENKPTLALFMSFIFLRMYYEHKNNVKSQEYV